MENVARIVDQLDQQLFRKIVTWFEETESEYGLFKRAEKIEHLSDGNFKVTGNAMFLRSRSFIHQMGWQDQCCIPHLRRDNLENDFGNNFWDKLVSDYGPVVFLETDDKIEVRMGGQCILVLDGGDLYVDVIAIQEAAAPFNS